MTAINILFIIMISTNLVLTSNLNCVIDAFDKERQETGKALAAQLAQSPTNSLKKSPTNSDNDPKYKGDTIFQRAKKFVKNVVGISDPKIEPVSYATLINSYFESKSLFIPANGRTWIYQQCLPFVDGEFKIPSRSLYVCGRLYHFRKETVEAMMLYQGVGYLSFGRILKEAAKEAQPETSIESRRESFATVESELRTAEKAIENFYGPLVEKFLSQVDSRYSKFIQEAEESGSNCKVPESLRDFLPVNSSAAQTSTAIGILLAGYKIKKDSTTCQTVKNVISDYRNVLTERPNSLTFVHLADKILNKLRGKQLTTALSQGVLFPFCVSSIFESGEHGSVKVPKVCQTAIEMVDEVTAEQKIFAVNALESNDIVQSLKNIFTQAINEVRNDHMSDFDKLPKLVRNLWEVLLKRRTTLVDLQAPMMAGFEVREELFVPLLLSMEDLLSQSGIKTSAILSPEFIELFKETADRNLYSSSKVTDLVETYRTTTIKSIGAAGKKAKMHQFVTKLADRCRLMPSRTRVEICLDAIRGISYRPVLHFRYTDPVFDLIIDRVNERLSKYDLKKSNKDEMKKKANEGIRLLLEEFQEELKRLTLAKPDLVKSHNEVRSLMYILVAKSVFIEGTGLLPAQSLEFIEEFAAKNFAELTSYKLRHFEFSDLMAKMKSFISFKTSEERSEADKLRNLNASESDSNLLEFGLSGTEKREIKKNLHALFENYSRFSDNLKRRLNSCTFKNEKLDESIKACGLKNGRQCLHLNPFLLALPCPAGFDVDPKGYCVAVCPDMFTTDSIRFCGKPLISLVESRPDGNGRAYKCGPGFEQEGLLCIARCPVGWRDFGRVCERPNRKFNFKSAVLMVE